MHTGRQTLGSGYAGDSGRRRHVAGSGSRRRLVEPGREVRAFVSDPAIGAELRALGVKVALGDVSDDSHVQGSCTNCFTAVLITEAARDGRARSFATNEEQVLEGWAAAAAASGVTRVIWVHDGAPPPGRARWDGVSRSPRPRCRGGGPRRRPFPPSMSGQARPDQVT